MRHVSAASARVRLSIAAAQIRGRLDLVERRRIIRASPYFDPEWYLDRHSDLRDAGVDPLEHFVRHGESEGRDPGPDFDTDGYLWLNPAASGSALTHYHRTLSAAGLTPSELAPLEVVDVTQPAISNGWIDTDWYRTAEDERVHPWLTYRRSGGDPSPVFDEQNYVSRMPADDHRTALEHWLDIEADGDTLDRGDRQLRPLVVARSDVDGRPIVQHTVRDRGQLTDVSVVVMIHAYYPELLGEILDRLRFLPAAPDLLVSVTDEHAAIGAHGAIDAALGQDQHRIVKVVPSRGRNFAPLLISFARELAAHDVVLHMHTKRSLYTGHDRTEWRDHLLRGLLRSPAAVDAVISLLADSAGTDDGSRPESGEPPIGLVHPPIWPGMPHWAHHWLANGAHGRRLYEQLGVNDRLASCLLYTSPSPRD